MAVTRADIVGGDTTAAAKLDAARVERANEQGDATIGSDTLASNNSSDAAARRGAQQFDGALTAYRLQTLFATQDAPSVVAVQNTQTQEPTLAFKVKVPASGDARELRDTLLRDYFNFTDADIAEFDRQTVGRGLWINDSRYPERWATADEVKSWKTEDGQTTITMREGLVRDIRAFRERRVENAPLPNGNEPPATFNAADGKPQIPENLRHAGRIDAAASPEEAAAFITERLPFGMSYDLRAAQAQFFTQALRDHADDPRWVQNFLRSLGTEKSAELIEGAVEPGTYRNFTDKQVTEYVGTVRDALARLVNAGMLNRADMDKLVGQWSEGGNLNPWLASELFAKASSENVKNLFAQSAITRALQTDGRNANDLSAAATHVLVTTSPQNQARQLTPLINSGNFDRLMLQAKAGEKEMPQLSSLVSNSRAFGGRPEFEQIGRSTELLESLRRHFDANPDARPLALLTDRELADEYRRTLVDRSVPLARVDRIEDEIERRATLPSGVGASALLGLPREPGAGTPYSPANTNVTPEVAARILENVSKGEPPFKPELGKGGVSWFVSEGTPYVGVNDAKNVQVPVEVGDASNMVRFGERELVEIYNQEFPDAQRLAEEQYRQRRGLRLNEPITSRKGLNAINYNAENIAQSRMWDKVAERVRNSESGIGKVELRNSRFSRQGNGEFTVVRDAASIRVRGGIPQLLETLRVQGVQAEPVVVEAAEALAKQQKWAGHVRGVFRVGGRVLIVVGLANDAYKIYTAKDKVKAVVESAGGWAGATAGAGAFATWFAPADAAGPWAWAAHGVGTLIAGGIGYWVGSETTRTIYELVVDEQP
ncbi:MAG TPA: hypothetical protein VF666_16145 [Pyrinomonadaceae bacterium]|jgi:hypothetical protein